ncbi:peptidase MA family metallohydrolase [Algisphaera agarilytica]|uniref:DUF1570 domain-containing protein n=1 Tax=Algisphaera agarilytica TaxID=1385975 RepID=A0A7X0H3K5_9BACT|nr:DUF1570 domain-containing protein [Algisphaera agarilytica]MBB6428600.1 hypothetical protein [Algisphaera agarilytica]
MRLGSVSSILVIGSLTLAGAAAGQHSPTTPASERKRIVAVGNPADDLQVFASHHYHIHTNLSREETVPFGRHMDAVFKQYERRFADYTQRDAGLMPLYLFRHQDEYLDFMKHHGIDATGSGGMFFVTHSIRGLATWAHGHSRSQTLRTLQHEGFHQFAWDYLGPNLPTWMNEGLAQYFEDAVILEHGMELGLGDPDRIELVRDALEYKWAVDMDELLSLDNRQWSAALRSNGSRSELLYAQSWSMVYYMIHGDDGRYLGSFEVYLRLLSEGHAHDKAFRSAFGYGALDGIEKRWRDFALQQQPDPVNVAAERLEFLGSALAFKAERDERMPRSFKSLRHDLQSRGFKLTRTHHGHREELNASDDHHFTYTRPGGQESEFLLLEPAGYGLPPRLAAPGLSPEPILMWERTDDGELVFDIEYR